MKENKAYVVTAGEYSDYRIKGIFSSREKAEEYVINSIKSIKLYSNSLISYAFREYGLLHLIGLNRSPLPIILDVISESPTTFLRMFIAPFTSAFISLPTDERNRPRFTLLPKYVSCLPTGS